MLRLTPRHLLQHGPPPWVRPYATGVAHVLALGSRAAFRAPPHARTCTPGAQRQPYGGWLAAALPACPSPPQCTHTHNTHTLTHTAQTHAHTRAHTHTQHTHTQRTHAHTHTHTHLRPKAGERAGSSRAHGRVLQDDAVVDVADVLGGLLGVGPLLACVRVRGPAACSVRACARRWGGWGGVQAGSAAAGQAVVQPFHVQAHAAVRARLRAGGSRLAQAQPHALTCKPTQAHASLHVHTTPHPHPHHLNTIPHHTTPPHPGAARTQDVRPQAHANCACTHHHITLHHTTSKHHTTPHHTQAQHAPRTCRIWADRYVNSQSSMNSHRWDRPLSLASGMSCARVQGTHAGT